MEVILLERVEKLGQMGQVVKVKDGFARNYLLPKKKALRATAANREKFEKQRVDLEKQNAAMRSTAEKNSTQLDGKTCVLLRQASESGQLYGSVTAVDVAEFLKGKGFDIDRRKLILPDAIKALGEYDVPLKLHRDVTATVTVEVVKHHEEAPEAEATEGHEEHKKHEKKARHEKHDKHEKVEKHEKSEKKEKKKKGKDE